MKKRKIQVPFYCVNSQVLWKDEEAVKNAVLVDKKVSQLGMDAIFTVSSEDVSKVKKAVNRVKLAIDFENAKPDNLERLKAEGAEIIIFDDLESIFNIKNILEIVKELDYSVLVRTAKPFEIPENVLNYLDIIKWKFGEDTAELLSDTQLTAKQNTFLKNSSRSILT